MTLFERGARAMTLTDAGVELVEHVRAMGEAAAHLSLAASGQSQAIEGHVSITATDMMATYLLPPVLNELRETAPNIVVELIASNDIHNLNKRDADIAIRHARPEQDELIAQLVGNASAQLYGSKSYLNRTGHPASTDDLQSLDFVGTPPNERFLPTMRALGIDLKTEQYRVRTASGTALIELVRHGIGVTFLPQQTAKLFPELVPVLRDSISFPIPVWLVTHRELHTSRRIRVVFDRLKVSLSEML